MSNAQLPPELQAAVQASRTGDTEAALRLLQAAVQATPDNPMPHFLLAAEFAQAGRMAEAEASYANTVLLAPTFEAPRFQLGLLQFTSGRPSVAMLTWRPLLELPEDNPFNRFVCGFGALAADRFDEAAAYLREGMSLNHTIAPLNDDMQLVIDRITPLLTGRADAARPTDDEAAQAHHVLLANYQQGGPAH